MTERRNNGIALLVVFALLAWTAAAFADFTGKVVAVQDGDTLEVMKEGVAVRVRLYGIDCPEKGQAFGQRAKQFTSDLAFGKTVKVREKGRDRYGRTVGEVILEDGRSLNRELVRAGLAWWYQKYSSDATLGALEKEARAARRGLWADANPVPPWEVRNQGREVSEPKVRPQMQGTQEITVFITQAGKKYHQEGCRFLSKSKISISLKDAKARGYEPCSVCSPPR